MTTTHNTGAPSDALKLIRNRTFDELAVGDTVSMERTLNSDDIALFAIMSGDVNPQHLDPEYAASTRFHGVIAHGMWGAALISALLGTRLPGSAEISAAPHMPWAITPWKRVEAAYSGSRCCGLTSPDMMANSAMSSLFKVRSMLTVSPTANSKVRLRISCSSVVAGVLVVMV